MLKGKNIKLRNLIKEDVDFLFDLENDETIYELNDFPLFYSRETLKEYIDCANNSEIFESNQLRLIIELDKSPIGSIDLFDFCPVNLRAGVSIILIKNYRNKGFGKESIKLLSKFALINLNLHQLYCNISSNNGISISMFQSCGFQFIGTKKDWMNSKKGFVNVNMYQLIL